MASAAPDMEKELEDFRKQQEIEFED